MVACTVTVAVILSSVMYNKLYLGHDWLASMRIVQVTT